ncbi:MAG: PAS domain S-box protein [Gemmatimonadaceae bacterium]|nr:PAS domain S-box protein [Gemmatimonadaceae bacterium]
MTIAAWPPPAPKPGGRARNRFFARLRLRPQLMLLALVAMLPFVVLVIVNVSELAEQEDAAVRARTAALARAASERVSDHVHQVDALLLVLSRVVSTRPSDALRNDTLLRSVKRRLPAFYNDVAVWLPNGDNVGSSRDSSVDRARSNVADRKYFREAVRTRGTGIGEPAISRSTGDWTVGVARAIVARDGSLIGVVSATTRLTRLGELLTTASLPAGSVVTLFDEDGRVLARSLEPDRWLGRDASVSAVFRLSRDAGAETVEVPGVDGVPRLTGFMRVADVPWTVAVGVPADAAMAPVRAAIGRNLALAGLALTAALFLAAWLGGRTARPLGTLAADAAAFGGGALSHRTAVDGTDEIGMLGRAFNDMARTVEQRTAAVLTTEARARRLIESNLIGIVVADSRGAIVEANDVFLGIVGYTRQELAMGLLNRDALTPAEFRPMDAWAQLQLEQTGSAPPWEQEYLRRDGRRVPVLVGIAQLPGIDRQYASFVLDLTQRIAAEEALRETHDTLRALIVGAPLAIFSTDSAGRVETWNPQAERLFGWSTEEASGKAFPISDTAGDGGLMDALDRALTGEPVADVEARISTRSGASRDVSVSAAPLRDAQGAVRGAVAFVTDIAARKQAERALAERDEQYRLVTDGIPFMIAYVDREERYRFVNSAFAQFVQKPRTDVVGSRVAEVIGAESYAEIRGRIEEALRGLPSRFDLAVPDRTGPRRLEVTYIPHTASGGIVDGFFSIAADVTTRQALEEQHHQVRTLEAVGQLAAGIAHDFNDALTVINGYSELLRKSIEPSDARNADLAEIEEAAARVAGLVRQLLAFGGLQTVEPVVGPINEIVTSVEPALQHALGSAVTLTTSLAPDAGHCYGDPARVQQVLVDLALNARAAMPDGGRAHVETCPVDVDGNGSARHPGLAAGAYAVLVFTDSGVGMDAETKARAFAPFFTTRDHASGAGLGLATAYGIVRQLGGQIYVESEPGEGTSVEIWFPRVPSGSAFRAPSPSALL